MKKIILSCLPCWTGEMIPLSLGVLKAKINDLGNVKIKNFDNDYFNRYKISYEYIKNLHYIYRINNPKFYMKFLFTFHLKKIIKKIIHENPNIICFSVYKSNILSTYYICKKLKEKRKNIKIILGGPNVNFNASIKFLSKYSDHIVQGEGEYSIREIIKNGKINKNQKIVNLEKEPTPDFSDFNLKKYKKILPYYTTRGCYNKCNYCIERIFFNKFRIKSANKIYNDLIEMKNKYKISSFFLCDPNIFGTKKNLEQFCDLIIKNKIKINWGGQIRIFQPNKNLIKKMKKAGCKSISIGIESGSQKILDSMNKNYEIKKIEVIMKNINKIGIKINLYFIVGYPTESWRDFLKTIRFIFKNKINITQIYLSTFSFYEKTEIYKKSKQFKIKNKNSVFWTSKNSNMIIRVLRYSILNLIRTILQKRP